MQSPGHPNERDLDVANLRQQPPMGSVKQGHGPTRGRGGLRRYLVSGMVVVVLALFSAVVWFAYQDLMPGGDTAPPLIRADAGELKREPDERGGLPVVNAESAIVQALDEPESPVRVERILPRESNAPRSTADVIPEALEAEPDPETADKGVAPAAGPDTADADTAEPAVADAAAVADADADAGADAGEGTATTDTLDTLLAEIIEEPAALGAIEPAAGPTSDDPLALAKDVPMPADGMALPETTAASSEETAAAEALATPSTAATRPARPSEPTTAATAPAPAPAPAPSSTAVATAAAPEPSAPAAPAETTLASLPSPALAASFDGAYRVQLLAVRDEEPAAGAWSALQTSYPDVLGPLRSQIQQATIDGDTFYRLQAGPFVDRTGAMAVCEALQARGADCFVVAPTS